MKEKIENKLSILSENQSHIFPYVLQKFVPSSLAWFDPTILKMHNPQAGIFLGDVPDKQQAIVDLVKVIDTALDFFETQEEAIQWVNYPESFLFGSRPCDACLEGKAKRALLSIEKKKIFQKNASR